MVDAVAVFTEVHSSTILRLYHAISHATMLDYDCILANMSQLRIPQTKHGIQVIKPWKLNAQACSSLRITLL